MTTVLKCDFILKVFMSASDEPYEQITVLIIFFYFKVIVNVVFF